jgi:F-type H+-transporting ATPase subunit gamma
MSLIEVKNKIQSTKNTKKITKAMQLVAANKMKHFQKKAFSSREYAWKLLEALQDLHTNFSQLSYGEQRTEGATLFVLMTSDKGLAGSLNTRLIKELLRSDAWNELSGTERLLITVGKKSKLAAKREGIPILKSFEGIYEDMTPVNSLKLVAKILEFWEENQCKKVILVSPHYVNPFDIKTTQKQYLPFTQEMIQTHFNWRDEQLVEKTVPIAEENLEAGEDHMLARLGFQIVNALFIQAFYELKAAEYSSRMVAMKSATEAADDIIRQLTLDYNKARQAKITQELSELAAGSAAQN